MPNSCAPIRPLLQEDGLSCVCDAPAALFGAESGSHDAMSACQGWRVPDRHLWGSLIDRL